MSATVGVLALQGDVREHLRMLAAVGAHPLAVRRRAELEACDALVVPGGESTTMAKLARAFDLLEPLRKRIADGMPTFGTCAGMILLADRVLDGVAGQETLGGLDVTVRRNAFGRQVASFEDGVDFSALQRPGQPARPELRAEFHAEFHAEFWAVFIRAPWVEQVGPGVEVLARVGRGEAVGRIVAVRQGPLLATSFHPEVGDDDRLHRYFVEDVVAARRRDH